MNTQFLYSRLVNLERQMPKFYVSETRPPNLKEGEIWFQILDADIPVTDYVMRFDASALDLANNAKVAQWQDLSGNGFHVSESDESLQPTFLEAGLNGNPTVQFEGQYLNGAIHIENLDELTIFIVAGLDESPHGSQYLACLGEASSNTWRMYYSGSGQQIGVGYGGLAYADANTDGAARVYSATYERGISRAYVDGIYGGSGDGTSTGTFIPNDEFALGKRVTTSQSESGILPLYGRISEVVVFNRILNSAETHAMNTYLRDKWGI